MAPICRGNGKSPSYSSHHCWGAQPCRQASPARILVFLVPIVLDRQVDLDIDEIISPCVGVLDADIAEIQVGDILRFIAGVTP